MNHEGLGTEPAETELASQKHRHDLYIPKRPQRLSLYFGKTLDPSVAQMPARPEQGAAVHIPELHRATQLPLASLLPSGLNAIGHTRSVWVCQTRCKVKAPGALPAFHTLISPLLPEAAQYCPSGYAHDSIKVLSENTVSYNGAGKSRIFHLDALQVDRRSDNPDKSTQRRWPRVSPSRVTRLAGP
jgi:hypothetical protein